MATYYVETYRPAYPERGVKIIVHPAKRFGLYAMQMTMTAVFRVDDVTTKQEAIACVLERFAGHKTEARLVFGGKKP